MRIRLRIDKSVHENAAAYYEEAKRIRKKIEGLKKAIAESERELEKVVAEEKKKRASVRIKREKRWFEKFHFFYTSSGKLAIGGKDAKQNDLVFAKHMEENDLFFHADIQGASAIILKDGVNASEEELKEVAQFAASFSNAWKNANASCDVYAVKRNQLSKHAHGGYIPVGGFGIIGERRWFKNTKLGLRVGIGENGLEIIPTCSKKKLKNEVELLPARTGKEKGELAKALSKRLNLHPDDLLQILPNGKSKTKV